MVNSLTNHGTFENKVGNSQLSAEHVQEKIPSKEPQTAQIIDFQAAKDNKLHANPETPLAIKTEVNHPAVEENKASVKEENEPSVYTNSSWEKVFKTIKPITDMITKNQITLSKFGSFTHGLDAFVRVTGIGKGLEKQVGDLSMWWSKAVNPLGAILKGFESLAKNNLVDALIKFSLLSKLSVKVAPNLGIPLGIYLSDAMTKLISINSGVVKEVKDSFGSMSESVNYNKDFYKNFFKEIIHRAKNGKTFGEKLENLAVFYGYSVLPISSLIGIFTMKDQINTPWARMIGFFRNSSGGLCDITFTLQRIRKFKEMAKKKGETAPNLKTLFKDPQLNFMINYLINSFLDLTMRFWKNPNLGIIQAQISNSIYEIANAKYAQNEAKLKQTATANDEHFIKSKNIDDNTEIKITPQSIKGAEAKAA